MATEGSREVEASRYPTSFISWRSIFAGLLIGQILFTMLMALGMAISGMTLDFGDSLGSFGWGAAIWTLLSVGIALSVAAYLAGRISNYKNSFVGGVEGLTIAALFFVVFLYQVGYTTGMVGRGIGNTVGGVAQMAASVAQSDQVQNFVKETLNQAQIPNVDLQQIQDNLPEITAGVATRLATGDTDAAVQYLANRTGISAADAKRVIDQVRPTLENQLQSVTEAATATLSALGWALFLILGVGLLCGLFGGALGSRRNTRRPLSVEEFEAIPIDRVVNR